MSKHYKLSGFKWKIMENDKNTGKRYIVYGKKNPNPITQEV